MALTPGTRLGPYEVTAQIGVGGMGEVYRAIDTNLKRGVAIKVLPASVASDAQRLARFQREAEVLAALNHPNIAAIYGLERSGATTALVMELIDGPTLADRIAPDPGWQEHHLQHEQELVQPMADRAQRGDTAVASPCIHEAAAAPNVTAARTMRSRETPSRR